MRRDRQGGRAQDDGDGDDAQLQGDLGSIESLERPTTNIVIHTPSLAWLMVPSFHFVLHLSIQHPELLLELLSFVQILFVLERVSVAFLDGNP